jgi:hypothetical protein
MRRRIIGTASSTIPAPTRRPTTNTSTAKRRNRESTWRPRLIQSLRKQAKSASCRARFSGGAAPSAKPALKQETTTRFMHQVDIAPTASWPNMARGRLAKRPYVQSGGPVSSTCEPCHARVPSLAGPLHPLRTAPCAGTYRLAVYSSEHRSLVCHPWMGANGYDSTYPRFGWGILPPIRLERVTVFAPTDAPGRQVPLVRSAASLYAALCGW